jgi:hypothetical protein
MAIQSNIRNIINNCKGPKCDLSNAGFFYGDDQHSEDMEELVKLINANSSITELDLSQNFLGEQSIKKIIRLNSVQVINFNRNNLNYKAVFLLLAQQNFISLDLSSNPLMIGLDDEKSKSEFINQFYALSHLKSINLNRTSIGLKTEQEIQQHVKEAFAKSKNSDKKLSSASLFSKDCIKETQQETELNAAQKTESAKKPAPANLYL